MASDLPTRRDIDAAAARIASHVHRTPVLTSRRLDAAAGAQLFFKCENLQRTGAFKIRGATNAVLSLSAEDAARGVATHSSGNHGAALAAAASARGIPAHIVVPEGAVPSKLAAIEGYGGNIIRCAPTQRARDETLEATVQRTGAHVVHPYNDPRIIAGQGTATAEFLEQTEALDMIVAPVGGGGLISGACLAAEGAGVQVVGAEPAGADDTARSLTAGERMTGITPNTVADGLRAIVGPLNFTIIRRHVSTIVTVDDEAILAAMRLIWHTMKLVVEPSSATVLAAVLAQGQAWQGKRIGMILSGGNADLDHLAFCGRCGWS